MELEVLGIMTGIEDELAALYKKIKSISHLESIKGVFDYLIEETIFHSGRIEGLRNKYKMPALQTEMIKVLYGRIKDTLYNQLTKEYDFNKCIDIMSGTEESISRIYKTISNHFTKMAEYYQSVAEEMNQLVKEEMEHTDILLKKKSVS